MHVSTKGKIRITLQIWWEFLVRIGLEKKKKQHFDINKESEMSAYNEAYKPKLLRAWNSFNDILAVVRSAIEIFGS